MKVSTTKRILGVACAALMLASALVGCATTNPTAAPGTSKDAQGSAAAETAPAAAIDTSEFVTIDFQVMGDAPTNGQIDLVTVKLNEILKAKLNCEMKFRWTGWTDWQTQYNLLVATGEGLDLVTSASDWLDLWPNAQKGAWLALDDLLPVYAPKTFAEIPAADWDQCKYNGKIVCFPENTYTQYVNHGFFYRGDWAKEAGLTKIASWEDLGKYFQFIKDNKPDVIPWDSANLQQTTGWFISYTNSANVDAVPGELIWFKDYDKDPYTVYCPYFEQTYEDFAVMMKQWADAGYWKADVLNNKDDTRQFLKDGKTGADQHHVQTYLGLKFEMDKAQPTSDLQMFGFYEPTKNLVKMPITHGATSISARSKNPERATMLYELIRQDKEFYMLLNYGIEGTNYFLNEKGEKYTPDDFDSTKFGFSSDFWGGRVDKFEPVDATRGAFRQQYHTYLDGFAKPYLWGNFVFDQTNVSTEIAAITQVATSLRNAIGLGMAGDPKAAVADFRSQLKAAGIEKVVAEVQKQVDAWKAATGK
jgi:putative aldouronate transport system substrate-binding protein